jgi:hypothetical protein
LYSGGIEKAPGETVYIHESIGFLVGVYIRRAEVVPDVEEYESENHGIGSADDAQLPADDLVVAAPFGRGPDDIDDDEGGAGAADLQQESNDGPEGT